MAKRRFALLYRIEDGQKVWQGDFIQKHELNSRMRKGWKLIKWG